VIPAASDTTNGTEPDFSGQVVVVTGARGGIGREIVQQLSRRGAQVACLDAVDERGLGDLAVGCDVSDEESVQAAMHRVADKLGDPQVLVNNAGILSRGEITAISVEDWDRVFSVNARGPFLCTRAVLPAMKAGGYGRIVTISSSAAITGGSVDTSAYGASKAAATAFTRAVSREGAPFGITANVIAPYVIDTDMIRDVPGISARSHSIPVGRVGTPADVARAVVFLSAPDAGYVTGQTLLLDGGGLNST